MLKKKIEEGAKTTEVDQAKIDELKAKLADAQARQSQAFDDDDDDAEEAADAEIKILLKSLKSLLVHLYLGKNRRCQRSRCKYKYIKNVFIIHF